MPPPSPITSGPATPLPASPAPAADPFHSPAEPPHLDATIDAALAGVASRWPVIAADADHPLLRWFIRHLYSPRVVRFRHRALGITFASLAFVALFVYFQLSNPSPYTGIPFALIGWTPIFYAIYRRWSAPPRRRNFVFPLQILFDVGDVEQWTMLQVTPLSLRTLIAIQVAFTTWNRLHRPRSRWRRAIAPAIYLLLSCVAYRILASYVAARLLILDLALLFLLVLMVRRLYASPPVLVTVGLAGAAQMILNRARRVIVVHKQLRLNWPVVVIVLVAEASFVPLFFAAKVYGIDAAAAVLAGLIACWIFFVLIAHRHLSRLDMDSCFEQAVARLAPEYDRLVDQILGRNL